MYESIDFLLDSQVMADTNRRNADNNGRPTRVDRHFCIPDDQVRQLPKRRRAPHSLPPDVPLPRVNDVIYLSSSSAWGVAMLVHEWRSPQHLVIQIWLEHVSSSRHLRPSGFELTQ